MGGTLRDGVFQKPEFFFLLESKTVLGSSDDLQIHVLRRPLLPAPINHGDFGARLHVGPGEANHFLQQKRERPWCCVQVPGPG